MRLLFTACIFFVISTCLVVYISLSTQKESFYNYANDLCLTSNALVSHVISGDKLEVFARQMQITADYKAFANEMDALANQLKVKYLYILVDKGEPGMYTYLYDATHSKEFPGERYALGRNESVSQYIGADEVMRTGQPFKSAVYYNDSYGELFYAYAPIFNSKGAVVAFVGTDIDIKVHDVQMVNFITKVCFAFAAALLLFFVSYHLVLRRIYTKPMQDIVDGALRLARGELHLHIPKRILGRSDEVGMLAAAFETANNRVRRLNTDVEKALNAVQHGDFSRRPVAEAHEGEYRRIIQGLNKTVDGICLHFDDMPCAVVFFDLQGQMLFANRGATRFAEQDGAESTQAFVQALLEAGREQAPTGAVERLFSKADSKPVLDLQVCFDNPRDGRSYALYLLQCHRDEARTPACVMLVAGEITEVAQARMVAEEATSAKSDFMARMGQEIRTPMSTILDLARQALQADMPAQQREVLTTLERAAAHLLGAISSILDFSRIEAGRLELNMAPLALREELRAVMEVMRGRAAGKNLQVDMLITPDVPDRLQGDAVRLCQIVTNLLDNALKFTERGGVICEVDVARSLSHRVMLRFCVHDTGVGMDEAVQEQLFNAYVTKEVPARRAQGGVGLGLILCKELVELLGGQIWVESEKGRGSTVTMLLPFELEAGQPASI